MEQGIWHVMIIMLDEIKDIGASIWISASAGTGKTKSLIDRILALLLGGVNPAKILCITYTRAAAAEMLDRLSQQLYRWQKMEMGDLEQELLSFGIGRLCTNSRLCDISQRIPYAIALARSLFVQSTNAAEWVQIKTIHSFCLGLLEKFPLETGLLPGFTTGDDYQINALLREAISSVMQQRENLHSLEYISRFTLDLFAILKNYRTWLTNIGDIKSTYLSFFQIVAGEANPLVKNDNKWLESIVDFDVQMDSHLLQQMLWKEQKQKFLQMADVLSFGNGEDTKKAQLLRSAAVGNSTEFLSVFLTKEYILRNRLCSAQLAKKYPDFPSQMLEAAKWVQEFWEQKKTYVSAKANIEFFSIISRIITKFNELKWANHCIDFDDIVTITAVLLKNIEWVMYKVDSNIDHILLDEAQDTSPEQWEIIRAISDEFFATQHPSKTIFVVGDDKQSIYSFQGADVCVFHKMHQYIRNKSTASGQRFHDVVLNISHRSGGNILSFVDDVCGPLFSNRLLSKQRYSEEFLGVTGATTKLSEEREFRKNSNIKHIASRSSNGGVVEIVDPFTDDDVENDDADDDAWRIVKNQRERRSASSKLAAYVGNTINDAITGGVWVDSRRRSAQPSDFMILFQRRDAVAMKDIASALSALSVPVCGLDRFLLEKELIVEDLIQLATFALFPTDDLSCACVLKSPIVGMNEEDLMRACIDRTEKRVCLWNYLLQNEELCSKYNLRQLQSNLDGVFGKSALEFFMIFMTDGTREKFINRLGEECLDVLHVFLETVMFYENQSNSGAGLDGFLEWFRSFQHEIKRESSGQNNAVRLMTVHSSKGLQSPFVLLADCHFFRMPQEAVLMSDDGLMFWDFSRHLRPEKIERLRGQRAALDLEESSRLLYVALTRAEDFLYILGEQGAHGLPENCWYSTIRRHMNEVLFEQNLQYGFHSLRYGSYVNEMQENVVADAKPFAKNCITSSDVPESIPDWFSQKLSPSFPAEEEAKTPYSRDSIPSFHSNNYLESAIYGECVHLLLSEMPKYLRCCGHGGGSDDFDHLCSSIGDYLLRDFSLSDVQKFAAKHEAFNVLRQAELEFLFDAAALSEVPLLFENREGRPDKVAFKDDDVWIVDFKTTASAVVFTDQQKNVPSAYIDQLRFYRKIMEKIPNFIGSTDCKFQNVRIAILWTKCAQLQELY
ncbi:MAG: UvrD-helicase domain-containing protein [Holosporaceae bacterium]|jgi:ATP-dependent helicase/nuclease subunit A|nr:UvrD-helicase domain-containing protein [Holosporaceae bacterium]